jgi:hypothetical protein
MPKIRNFLNKQFFNTLGWPIEAETCSVFKDFYKVASVKNTINKDGTMKSESEISISDFLF